MLPVALGRASKSKTTVFRGLFGTCTPPGSSSASSSTAASSPTSSTSMMDDLMRVPTLPSGALSAEAAMEAVRRLEAAASLRRQMAASHQDFEGPGHRGPSAQSQTGGRTITIIAWDDTLLCTSFLTQNCRRSVLQSLVSKKADYVVPAHVLPVLERIEEAAAGIIASALERGPTYIVTNSKPGWVTNSAKRFVPGLLPLLEQVTVVSAREQYEQQYPSQRAFWKKRAFVSIALGLEELEQYEDLVVIGSSDQEMEAADCVAAVSPDLLIKAVKMKANPSAEDLLREQQLVLEKLPTFVDIKTSVTITLERTRAFPLKMNI